MIPEDSEYSDNITVVKPMKGIQTCKYNPIVRITQKPDPVLSPYPLSPLRKVTESLLQRLEDNEIKTIVTQSMKHTEQNSVVNLKDRSSINMKESNRSSVRMPNDKFEDAYDDSAIVEQKAKFSNNQTTQKAAAEESKKGMNDYDETNANQHISNNNTDHLNSSIEQNCSAIIVQNADASTNTIIVSNDIEILQGIADSREAVKERRSISTNTINNLTPKRSDEQSNTDPIFMLVNDLEKDAKFISELSRIIDVKISEIKSEKVGAKSPESVSDYETKKNEIINNILSKYFKSGGMQKNSLAVNETEESDSIVQTSGTKPASKGSKYVKHEEHTRPHNSFQTTQDNINNLQLMVSEKVLMKSKVKNKPKLKSSSCNRDESSSSAGGKLEHSRDREDKQPVKETVHIDRHMNSFLDD